MGGQVNPDPGSIEEMLAGLSDANKEHRLRQLKGRFMLKVKAMQARMEVPPNHAKRALRRLAEENGTTVKALRRRRRHKDIYKDWKEVYSD